MPEAESLPFSEILESSGEPALQGRDVVEFRLMYQGLLRSNGSVADKFEIRRQLHPQLRRFWREHPLLSSQLVLYGHSQAQRDLGDSFTREDACRLGEKTLADTRLNGFSFMPLLRSKWYLRCSIDVLFLRREKPGGVFMRGDIDNRLKTLFDALQMPHNGQEIGSQVPGEDEDPFYVLLEEDDLIADVSVTTDRLLAFPDAHQNTRDYAVLVIDVKLQPTQRSSWTHVFS